MTCQHSTKPHSSGPTPTDILTYRFNEKMLKGLRDTSLSLSLSTPPKFVGISALAWPKLVVHMLRYQIIDVQVTQAQERNGTGAVRIPDITITYADTDDGEETEPAPPYRDSGSGVVDDEKASYPRSRSPSMSTLHPKRSWFFQKLHGQ
ncbi:hypothetical protein OG21DRAFT_208714 [Imleria badia]|nr:hypothetical protein OG21DRAFT_208714 [Imleria badia]